MNPDSLRVPKPGIGASAGLPAFGRSRKKLIDWHEILKCAADSDSRAQTLRSLSRKPSPQRAPVSREHSVSLAGQKPPSVPLAREATFGSSTSSREPGPATVSASGSQFSSSIVSAQAQEPSDGRQLRA